MKPGDMLDCRVTHVESHCTVKHRIEPSDLTGQSLVQVAFTADLVGKYCVEMSVNGRTVAGGPTHRRFVGGVYVGAPNINSLSNLQCTSCS